MSNLSKVSDMSLERFVELAKQAGVKELPEQDGELMLVNNMITNNTNWVIFTRFAHLIAKELDK